MIEVEEKAILLADVSRSTRLFRRVGDEKAVSLLGACIDRMIAIAQAHDGIFVHSRGDDVLCVFPEPLAALRAGREMLAASPSDEVAIHAGLHWGPVILARNEVFGDAVNLAARLSSLSNEGEVLISAELVAQLPVAERGGLRSLDHIVLKGMTAPIEVYAFVQPSRFPGTHVTYTGSWREARSRARENPLMVRLTHGTVVQDLPEGVEYMIGRSRECHLVLGGLWISRRHASVIARQGFVEYIDCSSTGSYIELASSKEVFVRRQSVMLTGAGVISPGLSVHEPNASLIRFEVSRD